jgi:hypothetical protein
MVGSSPFAGSEYRPRDQAEARFVDVTPFSLEVDRGRE